MHVINAHKHSHASNDFRSRRSKIAVPQVVDSDSLDVWGTNMTAKISAVTVECPMSYMLYHLSYRIAYMELERCNPQDLHGVVAYSHASDSERITYKSSKRRQCADACPLPNKAQSIPPREDSSCDPTPI